MPTMTEPSPLMPSGLTWVRPPGGKPRLTAPVAAVQQMTLPPMELGEPTTTRPSALMASARKPSWATDDCAGAWATHMQRARAGTRTLVMAELLGWCSQRFGRSARSAGEDSEERLDVLVGGG